MEQIGDTLITGKDLKAPSHVVLRARLPSPWVKEILVSRRLYVYGLEAFSKVEALRGA